MYLGVLSMRRKVFTRISRFLYRFGIELMTQCAKAVGKVAI